MELELKITCTCHQAKIAICCQMPLVAPIASEIAQGGFLNMLNPNLPSDLLSDHSINTSFKSTVIKKTCPCVSYNSKKLTVKGIHLFTLLCWSLLVVVLFSENISEACSVENSSGVACTVGRVVSGTIESSGTFEFAEGVVGSSGHLNSYETINRSLLQNQCVNMNHCHPNKYIQ